MLFQTHVYRGNYNYGENVILSVISYIKHIIVIVRVVKCVGSRHSREVIRSH